MLNIQHEQLRIQFAENARIIYMHKVIFLLHTLPLHILDELQMS